jgi:SAM-dependent methyltransferase
MLNQKKYSKEWVKDFYTQAGIWWGNDPQAEGTHAARAAIITRLCGAGKKRILELGTGSGRTAAHLADLGHDVVAVELNPTDAEYARPLLQVKRAGSLEYLQEDFYTVELIGKFDVITCWQVFGIGSDADQHRLLKRIAQEWLAPGGCVLLDVYHPLGPMRDTGKEWNLGALEGEPGSVAMIERCHYYLVHARWIDEWQPMEHPGDTLAQTIHCYTPPDFPLLLEGRGLKIQHLEIEGEVLNVYANQLVTGKDWFKWDYSYLVQLVGIENKKNI